MNRAIITKFIGPTKTKGARVKVSSEHVPSIFLDWNTQITREENHETAAAILAQKYNWTGRLVSGLLPDCSAVAHCFVPKD